MKRRPRLIGHFSRLGRRRTKLDTRRAIPTRLPTELTCFPTELTRRRARPARQRVGISPRPISRAAKVFSPGPRRIRLSGKRPEMKLFDRF